MSSQLHSSSELLRVAIQSGLFLSPLGSIVPFRTGTFYPLRLQLHSCSPSHPPPPHSHSELSEHLENAQGLFYLHSLLPPPHNPITFQSHRILWLDWTLEPMDSITFILQMKKVQRKVSSHPVSGQSGCQDVTLPTAGHHYLDLVFQDEHF